jgi:aspartate/methionine/tyrosine aminotransferase
MVTNPLRAGLDLPLAEPAKGDDTRAAVAEYYATEQGALVDPRQVLLTASTSEAYSFSFKLIADAGDRILLPQPSYPLLEHLTRAEGLTGVPYPLHYAAGEWLLDREAITRAWDHLTRGIVLVEPNNPTGNWLNNADHDWLVEFTAGRGWLLSDEVFADYAWQPRPGPPLSTRSLENLLVFSGLSKICALPQMKLGWVLMPHQPELWRRLELIADTWLSVSGPTLDAAPCWLARRAAFQAPVKERCRQSLALLKEALNGTAWELLPVAAGWCAVLRGPSQLDEESLALELLRHGYLAHPGYYYDLPFPVSVVISLLTPPAELRAGLAALISCGR